VTKHYTFYSLDAVDDTFAVCVRPESNFRARTSERMTRVKVWFFLSSSLNGIKAPRVFAA